MKYVIENKVLSNWEHSDDLSEIPEGIEEIKEYIGIPGDSTPIIVPKSVKTIGQGAFEGYRKIEIYDTVDPDAGDCYDSIDMLNGRTVASPGWMNNTQYNAFNLHRWNNHVITVRSAETNEIKYEVIMDSDARQRQYCCLLASGWGRHATFAFREIDMFFPKIKGSDIKIHVALNRLKYRVDLTDEADEMYIRFIQKNSAAVIRDSIDMDETEGIDICKRLNAIKEKDLAELIAYANEKNRTVIAADLLDYQNRHFPAYTGKPVSGLQLSSSVKQRETKEPVPVTDDDVKNMFTLKTKLNFGQIVYTGTCITRYTGSETEVTFPQKYKKEQVIGITACGPETPDNYKTLKKVIIPKGYEYIGARAFKGCAELEEIILPATLVGIGKEAFAGCTKLKKINLPKSLEVIEAEAFAECSALEEIIIPKKVETAGKWMFRNCSALKSIYVLNKNFDASDSAMLRDCTDYTVYGPDKSLISRWVKKNAFKMLTKGEIDNLSKR